MRRIIITATMLLISAQSLAKGLSVETMMSFKRPHSVVVSPDGNQLVYGLRDPVSGDNHLWLKQLNQANGSDKQLTSHVNRESNVVWAANGQSIYFLSYRSGSRQIWQLPLTGGEAIQKSFLPLDIEGFKLSPDGSKIVMSIDVKADCESLECTREYLYQQQNQPFNARRYTTLPVRHWDSWEDNLSRHLFVAPMQIGKPITEGVDIMAGWKSDVPSKPFAGMEEVNFNPDGSKLAFSAKQPAKDHAWSTNWDIFEWDAETQTVSNLTEDNMAWDSQPQYSADGRYLAYLAMNVPGYEAGRFAVMLRDNLAGSVKEVAPLWDRSASSIQFGRDNRSLIVTAQDLGQQSIVEINTGFGDVRKIVSDGYVGDVQVAGESIVYTRHSLAGPADIFSTSVDGFTTKQLTLFNHDILANVEMGTFEQFSFSGWNDEQVYGYWIKPVGFEEGKKYPLAYLIHGGPQNSFGNMFHYRWNAQLWAAQGFAVVMVDFHGSSGYGQAFTDSISGDWGGKPLEDLQKGLTAVAQQQPWIDADNACAAGGSYGGYMVTWIASQWPDGFNCLVNHAGLFDMPSFYLSTEELWFPEHDFGGPLWQQKAAYDAFNPAAHVSKWQTPMMVLHGLKDYRLPYAQGLGAYTALQRQGIESELIIFEQENHWILDADNLQYWYDNVVRWMKHYTGDNQSKQVAEK